MTQNFATSMDQSERLMKCGIPKGTADLYLEKSAIPPIGFHLHTIAEGIDVEHWFANRGNRDIIPAWSLTSLLSFLPNAIELGSDEDWPIERYDLFIYPWGKGWRIVYQECEEESGDIHISNEEESLIEAAVKSIEALHGNGMIFDTASRKLI